MKGYFRKRGKTWSVTYDVGVDKYGKRKQKSKGGFKTKREAQEFLAEVQYDLKRGYTLEDSNMTFSDFIDEWYKWYIRDAKIGTTITRKNEAERLRNHLGNFKLNQINHTIYQQALDELASQYMYSTVKNTHSVAKLIFKYAEQLNLIKRSPTQFAKLPRKDELDDLKFMEKDTLGIFLNAAKTHGLDQDYLIFVTLAYSGVRIGELLALKWDDILENGIRIDETLHCPNNNASNYQLTPPKTKTSYRTIELDKEIMWLFENQRKEQNELKMMYRDVYQDGGFVFAKEDGKPFTKNKVQYRLKRLCKIAGIEEKYSPHHFRHTHVSLLIESQKDNNVDIKAIADRMGHSVMTTLKIYNHVTEGRKEEVSKSFKKIMKRHHQIL